MKCSLDGLLRMLSLALVAALLAVPAQTTPVSGENEVEQRVDQPTPSDLDIEELAFIILMQVAEDTDADLKAIMEEVAGAGEEKEALRELISKVDKDVASQVTDAQLDRLHLRLTQALNNGELVRAMPTPTPTPAAKPRPPRITTRPQ